MSKWRIKNRKSENPDVVMDSIAIEARPKAQGEKPKTISLREMFNYLAAANSPDKPSPPKPDDTTPEMIREAQTLLLRFCPGLYADHIGGMPGSDGLFLIDENISRDIGIELWSYFGRTTNTSYEFLNGQPDKVVWQWAVANGIDAIISLDANMKSSEKDLGLIAVRNAHDLLMAGNDGLEDAYPAGLPLIIQIRLSTKEEKDDPRGSVLSILKKHEKFIFQELAERTTPYIKVSSEVAVSGPAYDEISSMSWPTLKDKIAPQKTKPATPRQNGSSPPPSSGPAP